ncbi:MAG TPA: EscU/YscU/HrcU family type III secretion system export apparatus switch protein, partial [Polyangiales bacterium]|nr:EscU/YscU/HrcU family type III secretion system export apparatus switch protein [Polyangiales bacterium]
SAVSADAPLAQSILTPALQGIVLALLPWLIAPPLAALLAGLVQTGFAWRVPGASTQASRPSFLSLSFPWASAEHWIEQLVAVAGALLVLWACGSLVLASLPGVLATWQAAPHAVARPVAALSRGLVLRASVGLLLLGAAELGVRLIRRGLRLRMTRRELEDERRASEGDPRVLGERRRRLRALANEASLAELSRACLVLHDAAGLAVALHEKIVAGKSSMLVVWIHGRGTLAARMVEQALALGVPVQREARLVAALQRCELTERVPAELLPRLLPLMAAGSVRDVA